MSWSAGRTSNPMRSRPDVRLEEDKEMRWSARKTWTKGIDLGISLAGEFLVNGAAGLSCFFLGMAVVVARGWNKQEAVAAPSRTRSTEVARRWIQVVATSA